MQIHVGIHVDIHTCVIVSAVHAVVNNIMQKNNYYYECDYV